MKKGVRGNERYGGWRRGGGDNRKKRCFDDLRKRLEVSLLSFLIENDCPGTMSGVLFAFKRKGEFELPVSYCRNFQLTGDYPSMQLHQGKIIMEIIVVDRRGDDVQLSSRFKVK